MFMKTQQPPTAQVIVKIIDWPGASSVKALITTLGPAQCTEAFCRNWGPIRGRVRIHLASCSSLPSTESQVCKEYSRGDGEHALVAWLVAHLHLRSCLTIHSRIPRRVGLVDGWNHRRRRVRKGSMASSPLWYNQQEDWA